MKRIWSLFMRVLLALNMFVLHLLTGRPDLTISGWSYIREQQGKRSPIKFIDWLFLKLNKQEPQFCYAHFPIRLLGSSLLSL
ncbi:hypothetical protein [Vibrio sp. 1978]|uniref:hypothetical protein n=1 Tax=Vibrio sp. 1978 TaxID=3074585 RepID=UPI0029668904|nr:hypothetical protein [Vibrio sp. 1978]MDW3058298.1 hypothetical protein [Vibrio sp. 1978]